MSEKPVDERGRTELSDRLEKVTTLFKIGELVQKQVDKGNYLGLLLAAGYGLKENSPLQVAIYQALGYAFQGKTGEERQARFYEGLASYLSGRAGGYSPDTLESQAADIPSAYPAASSAGDDFLPPRSPYEHPQDPSRPVLRY